MQLSMKELLCFDDVLLRPGFSDLETRQEVDLSTTIAGIKLQVPIISANMDTITGAGMAMAMNICGGLGILHRYAASFNVLEMISTLQEAGIQPVPSIGIHDDFIDSAKKYADFGVKVICIDVAHGHSQRVSSMITRTKQMGFKVIAGNVATYEGAKFLAQSGADVLKIGVGPGCFTPSMLINTEGGLKRIDEVKIGDFVYTHTGGLEKVIDKFEYERDEEIISINDIECTKKHKFYVLNKKFENVVDEKNIHEYAEWISADDLTEDYLLIELDE